jgi:hypothetical protein
VLGEAIVETIVFERLLRGETNEFLFFDDMSSAYFLDVLLNILIFYLL